MNTKLIIGTWNRFAGRERILSDAGFDHSSELGREINNILSNAGVDWDDVTQNNHPVKREKTVVFRNVLGVGGLVAIPEMARHEILLAKNFYSPMGLKLLSPVDAVGMFLSEDVLSLGNKIIVAMHPYTHRPCGGYYGNDYILMIQNGELTEISVTAPECVESAGSIIRTDMSDGLIAYEVD